MERTLAENIEIIGKRVDYINKKLGTNFIAEWSEIYKTWTMYEIERNSFAHNRNVLGFDAGKSMEEMYAYTDGIFALLDYQSAPRKVHIVTIAEKKAEYPQNPVYECWQSFDKALENLKKTVEGIEDRKLVPTERKNEFILTNDKGEEIHTLVIEEIWLR